jgi:hypothetical protein
MLEALGKIKTGVTLKKVVEQKKVISQEEELKLALARAAQGGKPSDIKQDADKLKETPEEKISRLLKEILTTEVQLESLSKLTDEDLSKKALEKAELRLEQDNKLKVQAKETLSNYEVALKTLNSTYAALRNDFLGEGCDINEEIAEEKLAAKPKQADLLKDVLKKMQEIKAIIGDLKNFIKNDASVSNQKKPIVNEKAKLQKELDSKKSEIEKAIRIKNKAEKGSDVSAEYNDLYLKAKEARQKKKFVAKKSNLNVGNNASRLDTMLSKVDDHIFACAELKERAKQFLPDVQLAAVAADVSNFEATIAKLQRELQEVREQLAARHQSSSSSTSTSTVETELQKRQASLETSLRVFNRVEDENAHEKLAELLPKLKEAEDYRLAAQRLENDARNLKNENTHLLAELARQRQESAEESNKLFRTEALQQENTRLVNELVRQRQENEREAVRQAGTAQYRLDALSADKDKLNAKVKDLEQKLSETIFSKLTMKAKAVRKYASTSLSNSREFLNSSPFVYTVLATGAIVTAANIVFKVLKPEYALLSQYSLYDKSLAQLSIASYAFGSNLVSCYGLGGISDPKEQLAAAMLAGLSSVVLNTVAGAVFGASLPNTILFGVTTSLVSYAIGTQERRYEADKMSITDTIITAALGLTAIDMLSRTTTDTFSPLSQYGMLAAGIVPLAVAAQNLLGKELHNSRAFADQALVLTGSALATAATTAALAYFEKVQPLVTLGASVAMLGLSYAREAYSRS